MSWPGHLGVHFGGYHADFAIVLAVSAAATAVLCWLGVKAYRRRTSRAYLLVTLALIALVTRPLVSVVSTTGAITPEAHHLLEHGLDAVVVGLVLGAVYYARSVEKQLEEEA